MIDELPLCECGCGERVTKSRNRFIYMHHKRGKNYNECQIEFLCDCGCGELASPGKRFITGHNKGNLGKFKPKPNPQLCKCGCGEYALPGNRFINGHQRNGAEISDETRKNMTKAQIERFDDQTKRDEMSEKLKNSEAAKIAVDKQSGGNDLVWHHVAYDFGRPDDLRIRITRRFHGQIHSPKGIPRNKRGYSLID